MPRLPIPPRRACRLAPVALALGLAATTALAAGADYAVTQRWTLPGTGGWDYLVAEPGRGRVYLTRGDRVEVLNTTTGRVAHTIGVTSGVHGVALAEDLARGFTSNGRSNSITEFDLGSLAVVREVPIPGSVPDAIVYEPVHRRLYTFNAKSHDATVLDARSLAVVATLPMPGKPEFAAVDGQGHVYVNIENEEGRLVRIDSATPAVSGDWPLPGCAEPTGLALDLEHRRAFSSCGNHVLAVTDLEQGARIARVPIGEHPDAVAYDATRRLVFVSNGAGTLSVIHADGADHYVAAAEVPTQAGARTLALDPESGRVFLVTAEFGPVPAATAEQPHPRAAPLPDTFTVLVATPR